MFAGPSIGIPNICSLYLMASIISTAMQKGINSEPNVDVSTVAWALDYHCIGAEFK
jgi:hypothetical protein